MPYVLFHEYFPELAERETRTIIVVDPSATGLPPAHYSLLEMFCDEPGCDCRRVFFYVVSSLKKSVEAVVAYGWESRDSYARWMKYGDHDMIRELQGPVLNMGSPQSKLAPAILKMVKKVPLQDTAYVERVKAHYRMFRDEAERRATATHEPGGQKGGRR